MTACRSRNGPGRSFTLGDVDLDVLMPTIRCVVPSRAQPGIEVDRRITKAVATRAQRCLGVYCWVRNIGTVRIADDVALRPVTARRKVTATTARRAKRFTFGLMNEAIDRLSR